MIVRIVKLVFRPEAVDEFLQIFESSKTQIRGFKGCKRLELLRETENSPCFMTYSWWDGPDDLENYRQSDLFKTTWSKTKVLFDAKPMAWSMEQNEILE